MKAELKRGGSTNSFKNELDEAVAKELGLSLATIYNWKRKLGQINVITSYSIHYTKLYEADDRDFKTAYSYFFEAFQAFDSVNEPALAQQALKYMLLSKVMLDQADEVHSIMAGKTAAKYAKTETEAMHAIAEAAKKRSLAEFNEAIKKYKDVLEKDPVVKQHFGNIQDTMFEKELSRLIQPYSCVQMEHIAKCVGLDRARVERRLSQMLLDKKFSGE
uniref:PCI domain-containing protein n=1 Tax=Globodera pallida TaxID=36090 RepID=A0A183CAG4_GLOPA